MKKRIAIVFSALMIAALLFTGKDILRSVLAGGATIHTHSVWTEDDPVSVRDGDTGCSYSTTIEKYRSITSWSEEGPPLYPAIAHFRGVALISVASIFPCTDHFYDFRLIEATQTDKENIVGTWDIYRDGTLVCSGCTGTASNLNAAVSSAYNVDIDDPVNGVGAWQFYANVNSRYDF
jgi:hypothetical protein